MFKKLILVATVGMLSAGTALAADDQKVTKLKEVVVTAPAEELTAVQSLPEVEGTKIYSGKKTTYINLEKAPPIVNNNYRQAFEQTPGLLISEESTPLVSFGYRGLNPDRAQFMQVLKDGIPIVADMFGYPEAYYIPPLQVVDHIDFVRGGSALMYGPQPGGALNFVTKDPYEGPFRFIEENSFGDHDFYSNYTALSGTQGAAGYYGYFHHRQSQGFREFNSQAEVYYGGAKIKINQDDQTRWILAFDLYNEEHGEPGGLTYADFDASLSKSTRLADHFELNRYAGSAALEKDISENTYLEAKGYGVYYERLSWRQRGGGFGTLPTGTNASTNDIQSQEFYTGGGEVRVRHDYSAFGSDEHKISGGVLYHHTTSPRTDKRGSAGDALDGVIRKDSDREMNYVSVFAENLFKFGKLAITPGVRLENIWQSVKENQNLDKTAVPLADESEYDFVALAGVGADLEVVPDVHLYGNFSQGYRPKIFTQAVPDGTNQIINEDLKEGRSWQTDGGLKGSIEGFLGWDASYFYMEFTDQTGTVGNTIMNVGDARHQGVEVATELDVIALWDRLSQTQYSETRGSLKVFYNAMFLDAEFIGGPNTGKAPQYAPDFIQRGGVEYGWKDRVKIRMGSTFVDDHFADDSNPTNRLIPSYKVWDLTAEAKVYKDVVSLFGGINNIFDEHYFARITGGGIDPADGRNIYGGVKVVW